MATKSTFTKMMDGSNHQEKIETRREADEPNHEEKNDTPPKATTRGKANDDSLIHEALIHPAGKLWPGGANGDEADVSGDGLPDGTTNSSKRR